MFLHAWSQKREISFTDIIENYDCLVQFNNTQQCKVCDGKVDAWSKQMRFRGMKKQTCDQKIREEMAARKETRPLRSTGRTYVDTESMSGLKYRHELNIMWPHMFLRLEKTAPYMKTFGYQPYQVDLDLNETRAC